MKRYLKLISVRCLPALLLFIFSFPAKAATSASAQIYLPAIDPSAYLSVYGSQTMQQWRYHMGLSLNYARSPLVLGIGNIVRARVIESLLMGDISGALGLTDWFQAGINVPVAGFEKINNQNKTSLGDVRLETKFMFLDIDRKAVGIGIIPYILFPTGSSANRVGNGSFAGGAKAVVDFDILGKAKVAFNIGYMNRKDLAPANNLNTHIDNNVFAYGVGAKMDLLEWLALVGEIYGSTNFSSFFGSTVESPLEVDGAFRFALPKPEGLVLTTGGGAGLNTAYGSPTYRALLSLTYPNPKRVYLPEAPPIPESEVLAKVEKKKIVITRTIHFEFDKAVIRPISFSVLDAVASILKQDPGIRKVRIEGHTDGKGSDSYNMKLSQKRADAVQEYLSGHGIETSRLIAIGYGETRPIDTNETPEGRARNRRVEFIILDQSGTSAETAP